MEPSMPSSCRKRCARHSKAQFVRTPKTADEARKQVDDLAAQHVDAIKGVLEAGAPGYSFNRMDVKILRAVVDEAHAQKLPVAIHTGNSADVIDAVALGAGLGRTWLVY